MGSCETERKLLFLPVYMGQIGKGLRTIKTDKICDKRNDDNEL